MFTKETTKRRAPSSQQMVKVDIWPNVLSAWELLRLSFRARPEKRRKQIELAYEVYFD